MVAAVAVAQELAKEEVLEAEVEVAAKNRKPMIETLKINALYLELVTF